ncbi:hypothetical protein CH330_01565 [candidate division WOR-3 bacterium JGI_Cruoil_03_51_56]|uniref:Macro domain-containing protein n=1 Tax=candidate division WOR-3 bacterium JGI_Cruoil_03_51_56 TaxID=1973747 RepID=A0A235BXI2_UNCW3|nr:MAG: hypothetical protein CH330_01565 [candidate division WOR-3 bacterium JGI_Cruoil_03_51_56]
MNNRNQLTKSFRNLTITVLSGDITEQPVDAIVNAANNRFWMGGGVAGAIKRRGGKEIEDEAMKKGPVEPGLAITTSAGKLPARYCIHAAVMGQDLATNSALITKATLSSLAEASRLNLETIAFPALGTGVGGFPLDKAGRLMIDAVIAHSHKNNLPKEVRFVLFTADAQKAFGKALESTPQENGIA